MPYRTACVMFASFLWRRFTYPHDSQPEPLVFTTPMGDSRTTSFGCRTDATPGRFCWCELSLAQIVLDFSPLDLRRLLMPSYLSGETNISICYHSMRSVRIIPCPLTEIDKIRMRSRRLLVSYPCSCPLADDKRSLTSSREQEPTFLLLRWETSTVATPNQTHALTSLAWAS